MVISDPKWWTACYRGCEREYSKLTYRFVITVEYMRHGEARTQLSAQMISRNILAFFRDVLCCNGRTMAMYLWNGNMKILSFEMDMDMVECIAGVAVAGRGNIR